MNRKNTVFGIFAGAALIFLAGCGTFINIQFDAPREWMEGKEYSIQFTVTPLDAVASVELYYRINTAPFVKFAPVQQGVHFSHTIAKENVVSGKIEYYSVVVDAEGKEHKSAVAVVRVYSRAEAEALAQRNLVARVRHTPIEQAPVTMDLQLSFTINSSLAVVRFFYSPVRGADFEAIVPDRRGQDYFVTIPASKLRKGTLSYFLKIEEPHADLGTIGVFFPEAGDIRPFSVRIIGTDEIAAAIEQEVLAAITHNPPSEVPETRDLSLELAIDSKKTSLLNKLVAGPLSVTLYSNKRGRYASAWEDTLMKEYNTWAFQGIIPKRGIQDGVNQYYFQIVMNIETLGRLTVDVPENGPRNPYYFNIISLEELKARLAESLFVSLFHEPVLETDGFEPLAISLTVENMTVPVRGVLHIKKPTGRSEKEILMSQRDNILTGLVPVSDQDAGYTNYYFEVTALYNEEGAVTVIFPKTGTVRPFSYSIVSREVAYQRLVDSLLQRVSHNPVTKTAEGQDVSVEVQVKSPVAGTAVLVYSRKSTGRTFSEQKAIQKAGSFVAVLDKKDIASGVNTYYIEVREPHSYFGSIVARLPENGQSRPFSFTVETIDVQIPAMFSFSPVREVDSGKAVTIHIQAKKAADDMKLSLKFRIRGERGAFQTIEMKKAGVNYSADIPDHLIISGKEIEYYFQIVFVDLGREFTYPESVSDPFLFSVKKEVQEKPDKDAKDKENNKK
ncbi:MAG: hypothetical protein JW904_08080 [Spirochaetales bacterium]|nr:hypothetical protein [Spirochaetales bacterium]